MTKSYVRTATRTTLKVEANLTQILNFKSNFHTKFEPFQKKKFMLISLNYKIRLRQSHHQTYSSKNPADNEPEPV